MGLDQYIFKEVKNEYEEDIADHGTFTLPKVEKLYYWRKNHQLNNWACDNFCPDNIVDFNGERLPLYGFMIDKLLEHILYNLNLPSNDEEGYRPAGSKVCFYYSGIVSKDILEAFKDCKKRVDDGEVLYYYASW